jgi:hypothetical protein
MPLSSFGRAPRLDDRLTRYLLGALPEQETEELDEQSVVDDDFADRLRVAETDLIDAYVRGTLPAETRERFESEYLASPARRARVELAKRFLDAVDAAAPSQALAHPAAPKRFVPWAFAAAAILLLSTGVLLVRNVKLSREMGNAVARAADADRRAAALALRVSEEQNAANAARQELSAARAIPQEGGLALVLAPETRGTAPAAVIALPPDSTVLPLDLRLDTAASPAYEVALKDPATNGTVWRGRAGAASAIRPPTLVSVRVPAPLLKAQHYSLELYEQRNGRPGAFIASYAFEVVRR